MYIIKKNLKRNIVDFFSHYYNRGKIVACLKCKNACVCQIELVIFGIYLFLCHLNVNTPKDNLVCLSLGTTSFY